MDHLNNLRNEVHPTGQDKTAMEFRRDMIEMALQKTPTGGNCKLFDWCWITKTELRVSPKKDRSPHYLNRNQHADWITLGCMIQSIEIAAEAQNFKCEVKISQNLCVDFTFTASTQKHTDKNKFNNLLKRRTAREKYQASPAPHISASQNAHVKLSLIAASNMQTEFKDFLLKADQYIWLQIEATKSFFKEVRFFDHRKNLPGIRSEDLGVQKADQVMLYILSFIPWMLSLIVRVPILNLSFESASRKNIAHSHFILISAKSLNSRALIEAGKQAFRAWIELEEQGYCAQPYSSASINLVDAATGHLPKDTLSSFRKLFESKAPEILKRQFNLEASDNAVWLLRVGKL